MHSKSEGLESRSIKSDQALGRTEREEPVIGLRQTSDVGGSAILEGPGLEIYLRTGSAKWLSERGALETSSGE
jgi:hypothetical protein